MMPSAKKGSVVWAEIADKNGHKKNRPAVILTDTNLILPNADIVGVAVTGTPTIPKPPLHVELPWHADTHPETGLFKQCWAICTWLVIFKFESIQRASPGTIPSSHLLLIERFVSNLKGGLSQRSIV
jgi:hypothetical protein